MKSAVWALVGLFLVAFATGCPEPRPVKGSPVEGGAGEGLAAESPTARPDVILVMVDTLRADRLGLYGYGRGTTPGIDRWAEDHATIYRDTLATGAWTLPSAASILTGLAGSQHRIGAGRHRLREADRPLAQRLREVGYATAGFCEGGPMAATFGFDSGFDTYECESFQDFPWQRALERYEARQPEVPLFLFMQMYRVHTPLAARPEWLPYPGFGGRFSGRDVDDVDYNAIREGRVQPTPEERAYLSNLYDHAVRRLDAELSAFLEALEALSADDELLVIVTSDHGEEFFEHGLVGHGHSLFDEILRVPLLVRYPDGRRGVEEAPVSTLDIAPTILEAAGLSSPDDFRGRVLGSVANAERLRVAEEATVGRALQRGPLKWIETLKDPRSQLYHVGIDPRERTDLAKRHPAAFASLKRKADSLWPEAADSPSPPEIEPLSLEARRALEALGYADWRRDAGPPPSLSVAPASPVTGGAPGVIGSVPAP